ncbi:MAG: BON domain-containing protein [Blastocatellia bacterium]|nr:BON domain-containing protein [Blastocatellia bacterium]
MKLTKKGYLVISGIVIVLILSGSLYLYFSSPKVRDWVRKQISSQNNVATSNPTSTPANTPINTPANVPISNNIQLSDAEIKANLLQAILKNSDWRKDELEITVNNGTVVLTGQIIDAAHQTGLEQLAHTTTGVKTVSSKLTVSSINNSASNSTSAINESSDEKLAKEIEFACYKTDAFNLKTIKISAKDGLVILSGEVRSQAEKLLAEHIAKETIGVKNVTNTLEVKEN